MPVREPTREYRTWTVDSRRWQAYRPRPGDVVIATYPKCGTTWMQRIVGLLLSRDPTPRPVMDIAPWIDRRFGEPLEATMALIEAQTQRRFLKSHLPADGLPIHAGARYIHVARDGRDASLSYHHHLAGLAPEVLARFDAEGLGDPTIGRPFPPLLADPADHFHRWLTQGAVAGESDGLPFLSFFAFERSWWAVRHLPNVLLVHYARLKADLAGEMRRIAAFLEVEVPAALWPALVEAAGFEAMRRDGDVLMGRMARVFRGGAAAFFNEGRNNRWQGHYRAEDVALYAAKAATAGDPSFGRWLGDGSLEAGT
ncbi:MAG: sulfotransferase domain-containing protein [Geminicoccaceae bacterium]